MEGHSEKSNSFRATYDIVGSLPLELVLTIAEYLEPADIVRYRKVSKRWRSTFSSDEIIMAALRKTLTFLNIENTEVSAAEAITYFEWHHRLQYGRPVKKMSLPWTRRPGWDDDVSYHSRRLCYRMKRAVGVEVLDLETGEKSSWTVDKEFANNDWKLRLSDHYVLIIIPWKRKLIAWDTKTSQQYARQIPRGLIHHISIEKDSVLVIVDIESGLSLYIWDLGSDHFREFGSFPDLWLWHVAADDDVLVTFEIDWDADPPKVQQTNWALSGRLLNRKHFHLPLLSGRINRNILLNHHASKVTRSRWINRTYGHKTVRSLSYNDRYLRFIGLDLLYDYSSDKFNVRFNSSAPRISDRSNRVLYTFLTPHIVYNWENIPWPSEIFNAQTDTTIKLQLYLIHAGEIGVCDWLPPETWPRILPSDVLRLFGDREVFGVVTSMDGTQLWFFNPNFIPDIPDLKPFPPMEEIGWPTNQYLSYSHRN
ncbi:hypothetical protein VTN49DRAFT_4139 [Thermomyces lanuginosus]|uniref:uncharacterized protein n=1 Tax=Thermomyces lanuginosus TaxID=5541 RepID=UPI003742674B